MKKTIPRWYEKNEHLKAFINLMQDIDMDYQCEIAVDIIMRTSSFVERDYEKMIQEISTYNPKDYGRWYDKNPNVHLAIESLRDLSDEQRITIVKEFTDKILNNHYEKLGEID